MGKFHKVYPAFYNGISQQIPELLVDSQCKDMVNCIPDIVTGISKRPPSLYVTHSEILGGDSKIVHVYDRGEGDEEYLFIGTGFPSDPLRIFNKAGVAQVVNYSSNPTALRSYLTSSIITNIKGLTVQDRTFLLNKEKTVSLGTTTASPVVPTAFYWLKRSSGDDLNHFRYVVYLDGSTFDVTGSQSDEACVLLVNKINADTTYKAEYHGGSLSGGNVIKITRTDTTDFTFKSWDSWGSQASFGWKGTVSKLSDLPQTLGFEDEIVEITGADNNDFTNYFVKSSGSSWTEAKDPLDTRGLLSNMPIACDRQTDGTFLISFLDWSTPIVGNEDSNPTPSFVGTRLGDIFFYKNRLGIASDANVVMSATASYYNFYIGTVLSVLDTDPIDIAIASTKASKIQYAKPFQGSLYVFTKDSQFELVSTGATSPTTVSMEVVSNYPMNTDVEPSVNGNSLFFISTTHNQQQLREYRKNNDTLTVVGVDLNISTPTLLDSPIKKILINGVLGYVICSTETNEVFVYSFKDNGVDRVQSAWSRWKFYENTEGITLDSFEYEILDKLLIVVYKTGIKYMYNTVGLAKDSILTAEGAPSYPAEASYPGEDQFPSGSSFLDTTDLASEVYKSEVLLPDWYPHVEGTELGSPKNKILIKKVSIEGQGIFDASVYRADYNVTYTKTHDYTTIQDLDLHVNSKVGSCDIRISNETSADFKITSFIMEGLYKPTSKSLR